MMATERMPKRIQRKRTKGWRMPEGAVYVGRPTRWGNHWSIVRQTSWPRWAGLAPWHVVGPKGEVRYPEGDRKPIVGRRAADSHGREQAAHLAVYLFRRDLLWDFGTFADYRDDYLHQLRGHDLACWCPLDQPCHADVLLELANSQPSTTARTA